MGFFPLGWGDITPLVFLLKWCFLQSLIILALLWPLPQLAHIWLHFFTVLMVFKNVIIHNTPEEETTEGGLNNSYKYFKDWCQEDGVRFFPVVPWDRTWGNRLKLKCRKFNLNVRKNFFTVWVTEHWYRLPKEGVELLWRYSKPLGTWPCPGEPDLPEGLDWSPGVLSNPYQSSVLWFCDIYGWVKMKKEWIKMTAKRSSFS